VKKAIALVGKYELADVKIRRHEFTIWRTRFGE
jgi:hypothetical protein